MTHVPAADRERFVVLDGMRGLAALVVICDHVYSPLLRDLLPRGYLAVDFFFVLSGFVLAHVYGRPLEAGMSPFAFVRARVLRLYPLYLAGTLLGALFVAMMIWQGWADTAWGRAAGALVFGLLLLPCPTPFSIHPQSLFPYNGPAWSLFFELVVNALYALLAPRLTRTVLLCVIGLGALGLIPSAFMFGRGLDGGFQWSNIVEGVPRVVFSFFTGVLIYKLRGHWRAPTLPAWVAASVLIGVFMIPAAGIWWPIVDLVAVLVVIPVLVAASADASANGAFAHICAGLGMLSYGIYVLHVPISQFVAVGWQTLGIDPPGMVKVATVAVLASAAAWLAHVVYDVPVRRWIGRALRPKAA